MLVSENYNCISIVDNKYTSYLDWCWTLICFEKSECIDPRKEWPAQVSSRGAVASFCLIPYTVLPSAVVTVKRVFKCSAWVPLVENMKMVWLSLG